MEEKKASPSQPAIKWALIGLIASIIITYSFQFLNIDPNSSAKYISYILFIAFLCLTQKEYKDQLGDYLTYGEGFMSGFLYSVFAGVLGAIFLYVYLAILSPEQVTKMIALMQANVEANKNISPEQAEQAVSMASKFMTPTAVAIITLIGSVVMGAIISLITAAIFKKERSPFEIASSDYEDPKPLDPTV
ncbi:Protein of unknown function [Mucilaginibacter pineti]|uniref:DUF4199 domain-containing protein n=1 Tax=Mucilaginibacter pineti TaxID=1391627 RepID=A0A1G6YU80_9SPHI|nr:DUF4199 domain-containing protein [Mucilaginibacter pineti]SDD94074.1 Protein of unknown function [Mucilaginibacter pineti]